MDDVDQGEMGMGMEIGRNTVDGRVGSVDEREGGRRCGAVEMWSCGDAEMRRCEGSKSLMKWLPTSVYLSISPSVHGRERKLRKPPKLTANIYLLTHLHTYLHTYHLYHALPHYTTYASFQPS